MRLSFDLLVGGSGTNRALFVVARKKSLRRQPGQSSSLETERQSEGSPGKTLSVTEGNSSGTEKMQRLAQLQ